MKSIKNHLMFIFPLMAIMLGVESFIVFDRVTGNYGQTLKSNYSMLVSAERPMKLKEFQQITTHISTAQTIEKKTIVEKMAKGMIGTTTDDIMEALPHFYTLYLDSYLDTAAIEMIKTKLMQNPSINKVETFGKSHNTSYNLYIFVKVVLWTFVTFMTLTSLFLVIKQMEIWQLAHRDRMQVMEIFGASTMLRSGILFKTAFIDALLATVATSELFAFLRFVWVPDSGIDLLIEKEALLFAYKDVLILGAIAFIIVIVAVGSVVIGNKEQKQS